MDNITDVTETTVTLFVPITFKKRQGKTLFIVPNNHQLNDERHFDEKLIKTFAKAHQWQAWLKTGKFKHLSDICKKENIGIKHANRVYRLNLVAPAIVEAILDGKQPRELCIQDFLRKPIPLLWCEQMELFRFEDHTTNNQHHKPSNQRYEMESTSLKLHEGTSSC